MGKTVNVSLYELKKKLYMCLMSVNVLEAIRFYVSFACSFAFAERELMEGNAKIIRLIARDEALHLTGTQHMLNLMGSGEDDPDMAEIAKSVGNKVLICSSGQRSRKRNGPIICSGWFHDGLNRDILCQYVEYIIQYPDAGSRDATSV